MSQRPTTEDPVLCSTVLATFGGTTEFCFTAANKDFNEVQQKLMKMVKMVSQLQEIAECLQQKSEI